MYGHLALAVAALLGQPAPHPASEATIASWLHGQHHQSSHVSVWMNREDPYARGQSARVYFRSDDDSYVTIVRIDTDGRIRILFPIEPWEDNYARGGKTFEVLGRSRDEAFRIDDEAGVGYVFAIASPDPLDYREVSRGDHWDYRAIADGQVRGDPYVAATDFAARIARESDYDYDLAEYYVERHYDYPRFVCYDCHSNTPYASWDPYAGFCSRFRIVIYDDPFYYPYRHYGAHVVIVRPYRPAPRYVFKDYDGRDDYVTRVVSRGRDRQYDGGRTSADVGGRGSVPVPVRPRERPSDRRPTSSRRSEPEQPQRASPAPRDRVEQQLEPRPTDPSSDHRRRTPAVDMPEAAPTPRDRVEQQPAARPTNPTLQRRRGSRATDAPEAAPRAADIPDAPVERERGRVQPHDRRRPAPEDPAPRRDSPRTRQGPDRTRDTPKAHAPAPRSTGEPELRRRRPH